MGAEELFRRAIARDPDDERAWDLLTELLHNNHRRHDEEIALCKKRLKRQETVRGRLMLARVYYHIGWNAEAEQEVRSALRLDPHDFMANLQLAVLLMQRADDAGMLSRVGALLETAGVALPAAPSPEHRELYCLNRAIYLALTGDAAAARRQVEEAEGAIHSQCLNEVLRALGPSVETRGPVGPPPAHMTVVTADPAATLPKPGGFRIVSSGPLPRATDDGRSSATFHTDLPQPGRMRTSRQFDTSDMTLGKAVLWAAGISAGRGAPAHSA